jgi:hypothetical protein
MEIRENRFKKSIGRLSRTPLLHFLALGALLFVVFLLVAERKEDDFKTITITAGDVEQMIGRWQQQFKRPPTENELRSLVENQVREEIQYREAKALGLDRDDLVIRRRLAQKLEFLSQDLLVPVEPTEEEITLYLKDNPERYSIPSLVTFSHIYFSSDLRTPEEALRLAQRVRDELNELPDPPLSAPELGDRFMLYHDYSEQTRGDMVELFGNTAITEELFRGETGVWLGPAPSAYGLHLYIVHHRSEPRLPVLEEVIGLVREDMLRERRETANEAFFTELRAQYVIEYDDDVREFLDTGSTEKSR